MGTLIGVFFLGSIGNAMNMLRLPSEVQFVAKGMVIVIAVSAGDVSSRRFRVHDEAEGQAPAGAGRGA